MGDYEQEAPAGRTTAESILCRPVDAASLAAFRIGFGILLAAGTIRFMAEGWDMYVSPSHSGGYASELLGHTVLIIELPCYRTTL